MEDRNRKRRIGITVIFCIGLFGLGFWLGGRSKKSDIVYEIDPAAIKEIEELTAYADSVTKSNAIKSQQLESYEGTFDNLNKRIARIQRNRPTRGQISGIVDTGRYSTAEIITAFLEAKRQYDARDSGYYNVFRNEVRDSIVSIVRGGE